jgi:hypothetical protein
MRAKLVAFPLQADARLGLELSKSLPRWQAEVNGPNAPKE